MLTLTAKIRRELGKKTQKLRDKGIIPAVLYGPKIKNLPLKLNLKEFEEIYRKAGESSLILLQMSPLDKSDRINSVKNSEDGEKPKKEHVFNKTKEFSVLIYRTERDPLSEKVTHVDFYQPILTEEVEATVPLVFEGEPLAVKELEGTLVKGIQELTVKALPQNLPHEIKVNVENLRTFDDEILIKDLKLPKDIKIKREADEVVALIRPPEKVEEELEKPIEEKVEEEKEAGEGGEKGEGAEREEENKKESEKNEEK